MINGQRSRGLGDEHGRHDMMGPGGIHDPESAYDDNMMDTRHDYYDYDEEDEDDDGEQDDSDRSTSELSIPHPNIDFDLVYALHTFNATVEGQASVVRGDALTLLDDSNSYWWLVKVLNTSEVGYIPAEDIEMPYERLARLNSHRNIELTRGENMESLSPSAQLSMGAKKRSKSTKVVKFTAQVIIRESDDDDDDEEGHYRGEKISSAFISDSDNSSDENDFIECSVADTTIVKRPPVAIKSVLDLENADTIKISLTPSIARGEDDSVVHAAMTVQTELQQSGEPKEKNAFKKFFSRGGKEKSGPEQPSDQRHPASGQDMQTAPDAPKATNLTVYMNGSTQSGSCKMLFTEPSTTASELIARLLDRYGVEGYDRNKHTVLDYYLVVKGVDGDEYTLTPSDKPVVIYHTLTAHLSTPMPSLRKARRISQLMSASDMAHMGGPKDGGDAKEVCFYFYSKSKPVDERDGMISIITTLFSTEVTPGSGIFGPDQHRFDKLVEVSPQATVSDVIALLLDKYHIMNGAVGYRETLSEPESDSIPYSLTVCQQGEERSLSPRSLIRDTLGMTTPAIHYRRASNPDRSSISSTSSTIAPPHPEETFFVLRRSIRPPNSALPRSHSPPGPLSSPIRQGTPIPINRSTHHEQADTTPSDREYHTSAANGVTSTRTQVLSPNANGVDSGCDVTSVQDEYPRKTNTFASTPSPRSQQPSMDEMPLLSYDFGMADLMVMIRGAARQLGEVEKQRRASMIRTEVTETYRENYQALEKIEKELDNILAEAVRLYIPA